MVCRKCGDAKPSDAFRPGHHQCRACAAAYTKAWNEANPEKRKAWVESLQGRNAARDHCRRQRANGLKVQWKPRTPEQRERRRLTRRRLNTESAYLLNDPCAYCGGPSDTVDHIVPVAAGGPHDLENYTAACRSCNSAKKDKPLLTYLLEATA